MIHHLLNYSFALCLGIYFNFSTAYLLNIGMSKDLAHNLLKLSLTDLPCLVFFIFITSCVTRLL